LPVAEIVRRWRSKFVYAGLAVLLIGNVAWTAHDYFVVWPSLDVVRFWHQAGLTGVADSIAERSRYFAGGRLCARSIESLRAIDGGSRRGG